MYTFFSRHRQRTPSPHSIRSSQLKNKITDTSLFAELVKDRHKRELELKKLVKQMEQNSTSTDNGIPTDQVDNKANENKENISTIIPMDIDDIPIPETDPGKLNDIVMPDSEDAIIIDEPKNGDIVNQGDMKKSEDKKEDVIEEPKTPTTPPLPNHISSRPPSVLVSVVPKPIVNSVLPESVKTEKKPVEPNRTKPKNVTNLPMPPGIDQEELEAIESPPSRSPSPLPVIKPKTPPRKSIKDLPMPPGKFIFFNCFENLTIQIY